MSVKILGVPWNKCKDELTISFGGNTESQPLTKRRMLATINRIYDILGLASPVTVVGKILYSKVCLSEKRWDEEITDPEKLREWTKWLKGMGECTTVSVPRSVVDQEVTRLVLHGFFDANKAAVSAAVSAAVYVVDYHAERPIKQTLLVAKSRVHGTQESKYSTSRTVLYWIKGKGTWSQFVRNRTKFIQEKDYLQWHYVPTGQNPSDIGSRGAAPKELSDVWLQEPDWMADKEKWPPQPEITVSDEIAKEKAKTQQQEKQLLAKEEPKNQGLERSEQRTLSTEEVAGARSMLIRHAQSSTEKLSERSSELKKGDYGMLRCEGRVSAVYQGEEVNEPVITPNILIRGKPVPVLEEDLDKFSDDDRVTRRMKFLQASKEDLRKRFVREYVHALEERQQSKGADDRTFRRSSESSTSKTRADEEFVPSFKEDDADWDTCEDEGSWEEAAQTIAKKDKRYLGIQQQRSREGIMVGLNDTDNEDQEQDRSCGKKKKSARSDKSNKKKKLDEVLEAMPEMIRLASTAAKDHSRALKKWTKGMVESSESDKFFIPEVRDCR
ncbi:hypothetical protein QZH41_017440, partial [Actinostola sp. cb2023]